MEGGFQKIFELCLYLTIGSEAMQKRLLFEKMAKIIIFNFAKAKKKVINN